jgi:hypothetical protein
MVGLWWICTQSLSGRIIETIKINRGQFKTFIPRGRFEYILDRTQFARSTFSDAEPEAKPKHVGVFETAEDAATARDEAAFGIAPLLWTPVKGGNE